MAGPPNRIAPILFWLYFTAWTVMLLVPNPIGVLKMLLFGAELSDRLGGLAGHRDKLIHAVGYFLLLLLASPALQRRIPLRILVIWGSVHGAAVEIIQQLGQKRKGDIYDWLADVAGLIGAGGCILLFRRFRGQPAIQSSSSPTNPI